MDGVHGGVLYQVVAVVVKLTTPLDCRTAQLRGCGWVLEMLLESLAASTLWFPQDPVLILAVLL